jgi:hypothetical protein
MTTAREDGFGMVQLRSALYKLTDGARWPKSSTGNPGQRFRKPYILAVLWTLSRFTYWRTMTIQDGRGHPYSAAFLAKAAGMDERTMRETLMWLQEWKVLVIDTEHGRANHHEAHRPARLLAWNVDFLVQRT